MSQKGSVLTRGASSLALKVTIVVTAALGGAGLVASNVFAALNPTESALKSKEENLANIKSSYGNEQVAVVKVSDINKVQNNVSVRDNNTKY